MESLPYLDGLPRAESAYVVEWLRTLMRAFAKGSRDGVELLGDGRARISVTYPSVGDLMYALQQFEALRAMGQEDAAAKVSLSPLPQRAHPGGV